MAHKGSIVVDKGAKLSPDRVYRYRLWRRWGDGEQMTFIGLNPSTADESIDDQTILKCIGFARRHGCEAIEMLNLFALRERDPKRMKLHHKPIGPSNDQVLLERAQEAKLVVACWGVAGNHRGRSGEVVELLARVRIRLKCFGFTKKGYPRHPVMLAYDTELVDFN